jgi:hypothetical protein
MTLQELDQQLQSEFEANKAEQNAALANIDNLIQAFSDMNNDTLSTVMSKLYKELEVEFIEENQVIADQIEEWKDQAVRSGRVTK